MEKLIDSIQLALKEKNYSLALYLAFRLPEICARISKPDKRLKDRVCWWYKAYMQKAYRKEATSQIMQKWLSKAYPDSHQNLINPIILNPADFFSLRGAFLFEGVSETARQRSFEILSRFKIAKAGSEKGNIHLTQKDGVTLIQLDIFCNDILLGVREWMSSLSKKELETLNHLVQVSQIVTID